MTIIENVKFKNSDYVLKFVTFYRHYVAMFNFFSFVHVINTLVFLLLFENRVHFNDTMLMVMESKYARIQCFFFGMYIKPDDFIAHHKAGRMLSTLHDFHQ